MDEWKRRALDAEAKTHKQATELDAAEQAAVEQQEVVDGLQEQIQELKREAAIHSMKV